MNWGTKLMAGMIAFMLFIVGMVIYMFHVHPKDALIEENYYEKGINYNADYQAELNVLNERVKPVTIITASQIIIQLKDRAEYELVLMRPGDSSDDLRLKGTTSGTTNLILVDKTKMHRGRWFLNLHWRSSGKDYLLKNNITL
jgi:hypothetical protein